MDSRFVYTDSPTWRQGLKQALMGTELLTIQPTSKGPNLYEFDLPSSSVLLFGPLSGFIVKGCFEFKDGENDWTTVPADKGSEVALQPNWFEHLFRDIRVFHNNNVVDAHDVPRTADPFVNTYLYAHMYSETKKCLFPEPQNPGRCVGVTATDWTLADEKCAWRAYSKKVFGDNLLTFRFIPPFLFPFYQQANFCVDGSGPNAIPMPIFGKINITLHLKDKLDDIFMKPVANTKKYRFRIQSIDLVVEEARLNPTFEKRFLSEKRNLVYKGISRFGMSENIPASVSSHRVKFQDVPMPEGIFIVALPKNATSGTYSCERVEANVFKQHNIKHVDVKYGNMPLNLKSPNPGDIREHIIEIKQLLDHFENPPFGVLQEPKYVYFDNIKEGGDKTIYPHVYINLTPSGKMTRTIPVGDNGHALTQNNDLDLYLKFSHGGATNDVTYLVYIFYTDANLIYDMKTKSFRNMYKNTNMYKNSYNK